MCCEIKNKSRRVFLSESQMSYIKESEDRDFEKNFEQYFLNSDNNDETYNSDEIFIDETENEYIESLGVAIGELSDCVEGLIELVNNREINEKNKIYIRRFSETLNEINKKVKYLQNEVWN